MVRATDSPPRPKPQHCAQMLSFYTILGMVHVTSSCLARHLSVPTSRDCFDDCLGSSAIQIYFSINKCSCGYGRDVFRDLQVTSAAQGCIHIEPWQMNSSG